MKKYNRLRKWRKKIRNRKPEVKGNLSYNGEFFGNLTNVKIDIKAERKPLITELAVSYKIPDLIPEKIYPTLSLELNRCLRCLDCGTNKTIKLYICDIGSEKAYFCENCKNEVEKDLEEKYKFPVKLRSHDYYVEKEKTRREKEWKDIKDDCGKYDYYYIEKVRNIGVCQNLQNKK